MAIFFKLATREPNNSVTHLVVWGKIGSAQSYGSYNNLLNFMTLLSTNATGYQNELGIISLKNLVVGSNIGYGVGGTSISGVNTFKPIKINYSSLSTDAPEPFLFAQNVNADVIGAGTDHFLVMSGSTLYAWGRNNYGQCNVPSNLGSALLQVDGGERHSVVLFTNTGITCWGSNIQNQCTVPVGLTASKIACGRYHNVALKGDGTVACWGDNTYGQSTVPVGLTGISDIGAGYNHSMAIRQNGTVVCWGLNSNNQCNVPASVGTGGFQIAGGSAHTALLKSDGSVICWGSTAFTQGAVPSLPTGYNTISSAADQITSPVYLPGSATKVLCSENATFVFCTGKRRTDDLSNANDSILPLFIEGLTSSFGPYGSSFYIGVSGYNPQRHDLYEYTTLNINNGESYYPIGYNTAWWISGTTSERKLANCWVSGFQENGLFKFDWFSPVDFSGCSLKPRQYGASWIGGSNTPNYQAFGNYNQPGISYGWNYYSSGFWSNILITKKHALASKHYSGPNTILNNVKWMRRDGEIITRNLTKISDLNFGYGFNIDMVLYELDTEIPPKDLEYISIYNILPKFNNFTESKTIDTTWFIGAGITTPSGNLFPISSDYGNANFQSRCGRRLWFLDGQSKIYSKKFRKTNNPTSSFANYNSYIEKTITYNSAFPSIYEPDEVGTRIIIGDSGTPVFITAANRINSTEPKEASYFSGEGTTWGRTLFCGLFDAGIGQYGATFINDLNNLLITRGLTGNDLLSQIDVDSVGPGLIWTAPVSSPETYNIDTTYPPQYSDPDSYIIFENPGDDVIVGEATVVSWDPNILQIEGVSGSFTAGGTYTYRLENLDGSGSYSIIRPYIIPINNGLGTTAGSNDILRNEATGYTFNPNDPFQECTEG
jgi:hypothetical protein